MAYEKGVASLTLKKAELQHAGNYYIHATNTHGTTVQSIRLNVVTKGKFLPNSKLRKISPLVKVVQHKLMKFVHLETHELL